MVQVCLTSEHPSPSAGGNPDKAEWLPENSELHSRIVDLEQRLRKRDEQRRALLHIMGELNQSNRRLADQRKAMLHILGDYESDRRRLVQQRERLDNSRKALLHILQDVYQTNLRLGHSRKAMIHIMGDLRETTGEMQRREQELRDKQEQLVQAAKLATLGELTTGVAHELNNPLNNIGLFVGNAIDMMDFGVGDTEAVLRELRSTMQQVQKATEIISHLRTFGRAAHITREPVMINEVIRQSLSLLQEQFRLRQIELRLDLPPDPGPLVVANAIRLEQAFINLLTNARDAVADSSARWICVACSHDAAHVLVEIQDSGCGIPPGYERRIFDPFFTTKEVGAGTGLGLSITYGIISDMQGEISVSSPPGEGARFAVRLPRAAPESVQSGGPGA
jgi:C4-dicarboxylate-specific signal transduction histidine kinase